MKTVTIPSVFLVGILVVCSVLAAPTPAPSVSPALATLEVEILSPLGKPISRGEAILFAIQTGEILKVPPRNPIERFPAIEFSEGHLVQELPAGFYRLEVWSEGWQTALEKAIPLSPGERKKISLGLQPGFVISGMVTDETGSGLDGATVQYSTRSGGGPPLWSRHTAVTASDGSFRITTLRESLYPLSVSAPGYQDANLRDVAAGSEGLKVVLKKGFAIKGKIVGDIPPPGSAIDIEVRGLRGRSYRRSVVVVVDSAGGFLVSGLEKGTYRLRVRNFRYVSDWVEVPAAVPLDSAPTITVTAQKASSVSGRVLSDRNGLPLLLATVELYPEGSAVRQDFDSTEADGSFRFDRLLPGAYEIKVSLPGDPDRTYRLTKKLALAPGEELTEVDSRVEWGRELAIRGMVGDEKGNPIPGALIRISAGLPYPEGILERIAHYLETDSTGAFSCSLVVEGGMEFKFSARKEGFAPVVSESIAVGPDQASMEGVALVLTSGKSFSVAAEDGRGKPIAGAIVEVEMESRDLQRIVSAGSCKRLTDARGLCHFENIPFGGLTVRGRKTGLALAEGKITLVEGESARDFTLVFEEGKTLLVTVHDEEGKPVAGASFVIMMMSDDGSGSCPTVEHTTGTDGTGAVEDLPKKPLRLSVEAEGYAPARFRLLEADQTEIEVVLSAAGSIAGRAVDSKGQPADNVNAHASREKRGPFDFSLDYPSGRSRGIEAGRFRLDGLKPGRYELIVSATDLAKKKISGLEVVAGGVTDAGDISLSPAAVIFGRVGKSPDGGPLSKGVIVRAKDVSLVTGFTRRNRSEFELKNLPAGTYTLVFQASGYREKEIEGITVAAGERKEIPPVHLEELSDEEKEELRREASFIPSLGLSWGKGSGSLFSEGLSVAEVAPGSVSEKAGIRPGDTVLRVNGKGFLDDPGAFLKGILGSPGTKVHLAVKRRDGTIEPVEIVIPEWDYEGLMRKMGEKP